MHADFIPHEAFWVKNTPKPLVGGFNELNYEIDSIRHVKPAVLLIDAGDVMTGNPITEYMRTKGLKEGLICNDAHDRLQCMDHRQSRFRYFAGEPPETYTNSEDFPRFLQTLSIRQGNFRSATKNISFLKKQDCASAFSV